MRIQSSVSCISWIPSEAVRGLRRVPFATGMAHYDEPPPEQVGPSEEGRADELAGGDRFRFANRLRTATLRTATPCRVAVATAEDIDPAVLMERREGDRREARVRP